MPPTNAELTAAFMCPPTLDEMMIQVRELRLQRTTVMAGFRFRDPTPAATSFSSTTRVNARQARQLTEQSRSGSQANMQELQEYPAHFDQVL